MESKEFNFNMELGDKFIHLNSYDIMTKLNYLIPVLGKCTIWEMRGILRKVQVTNITNNLRINFKYKLQSQLTTLYHQYE